MKDLNEALERNNMAFDPDQPRDSKGEWVAAGGGGNVDERAQRAAEVMRSMYYSAKDQKKVRVWNEPVYTHKGYIEIKGNGVVDIASLGGVAHQNACGLALVDAGFRVSGPPDTIKWIEKNRTSKTLAERN